MDAASRPLFLVASPSSISGIVFGLPLFFALGVDAVFPVEDFCGTSSGAGVRLVDR